MKVVVLGAGVVGVTSAYYLARAGYRVTVIDRQPGPGLETSFANAGEISPGYASPWAAPGVPQKALKWLFMKHAPLIIRPTLEPAAWRWVMSMLRNCTSARYAVNKERMVRLAEYSRDCLIALRGETGISYDQRTLGTLQLFRTRKQLDSSATDMEVLRNSGVAHELLDPDGCFAAEPGLASVRDQIVGGLRLPNDETGDCYAFTTELKKLCEERGVEFKFSVNVNGLRSAAGRVTAVETSVGDFEADNIVVSLGSYTPQLLKFLAPRLPIYPVKGYSITVPVLEEAAAPVSTVMDETYKVAITRLGSRIRVGGMAEIANFNLDLPEARRATLEHSARSLFSRGGDWRQPKFWTGLRPMTPDGTPVVGGTRLKGLYINSGHGTLGWTMACGSARVLADIMSGKKPEIESDDFAIARYA